MPAYRTYTEFFKELPISAGDVVYISSDLRKLVYQARKHKEQFDAQRFLNGLKERVGPEGTILIPAFNYDLKDNAAFDRQHTMPITGSLSVEALKDPSFARTVNPMHSFAVWGRHQAEILSLENSSSFGKDSPFEWLYTHHAKLIGIDVDLQQSLTYAHYAEEEARVAYRRQRWYTVTYTDGGTTTQRRFSIYAKKPGYVNQVNPLYPDFKAAGLLTEHDVNKVPCFVLDLHGALAPMKKDLQDNKARKMTYFSWNVWARSIVRSMLGK